MAWESIDLQQLAKRLGVDYEEVKEKHKLIDQIIAFRRKAGLSQTGLAKKLNVSQARIAKIESGIGTKNVSFDLLFKILKVLGYRFSVKTAKVTRKMVA